MTPHESIARRRMRNQRLAGPPCARAADVVQHLGAVQAQEYALAKWALGQRTKDCTDVEVERAFERGEILRTHVLRPTWHFVSPLDIRWMLALSAPRVRALLAYYDRKLDIDAALLRRTDAVLANALRGGKQLTRVELAKRLAAAGIDAQGQRLAHITIHAELSAVICSGARRGKQFTYALLDERAAPVAPIARDEALARLSLRYFTSHGPALLQDFAWWSGLAMRDAQRGVEMNAAQLASETIEGQAYWHAAATAKPRASSTASMHLLPIYDEQLIAYKERSAAYDDGVREGLGKRDSVFANQILRNGRVIGSWRRSVERAETLIETKLFARLDATERRALQAAAERYARFSGMPARLELA